MDKIATDLERIREFVDILGESLAKGNLSPRTVDGFYVIRDEDGVKFRFQLIK